MEKLEASLIERSLSLAKSRSGDLTVPAQACPTLPEALKIAARLISCFPNGGANAGDGYIAALAAVLVTFQLDEAIAAADPVAGVPATTRFLPTPADLLEWQEKRRAPARQFNSTQKLMDVIGETLRRRQECERWEQK